MDFSFSLHFFISNRAQVLDDGVEVLAWQDKARKVTLKSAGQDPPPLKETKDVLLLGSGWPSEDSAREAGDRWKSALMFALAHQQVGANLRLRERGQHTSEAGVDHLREMFGLAPSTPVRPDNGGVEVWPSDRRPSFIRIHGSAARAVAATRVSDSLRAAYERQLSATPKQLLAFELYGASFDIDVPDVRFVTLMMAAELLIEQRLRPEPMQAIVREAIAKAEKLDAPEAERQSFISSLNHQLQESIGSAGRRVAQGLGDLMYMGEDPKKFFAKCYTIRSRLVHGGDPRPTPADVDARASWLEVMVGDLISVPFLGVQSGRAPDAAP